MHQLCRVAARAPISVVLDDVRSLANVGLIFRLCDALRVERLYLCGITGHPGAADDDRPRHVQERAEREITKTAVMAIPYVRWNITRRPVEVVESLRADALPGRRGRAGPPQRSYMTQGSTARRCA